MQQIIDKKKLLLLLVVFVLTACHQPRNKVIAQDTYNTQMFFENHTFLKMNTKKSHQKTLQRLESLDNNPYTLKMQEVLNLLSIPKTYSKSGNTETWFFKSCDLIITWKLEKNMYYISTILNYQNKPSSAYIGKCAQKLY